MLGINHEENHEFPATQAPGRKQSSLEPREALTSPAVLSLSHQVHLMDKDIMLISFVLAFRKEEDLFGHVGEGITLLYPKGLQKHGYQFK